MTTTQDQQRLIDGIQALLEAEPDVEAAWLAGSLGSGSGDAFSDIDVLVLARGSTADQVCSTLAGKLNRVVEPVLINRRPGRDVLSVITEDWARFDLSVIEISDLPRYDARRLKCLFNRGEHTPPHQSDAPYRISPDHLSTLVTEFLRVLGLAAVVVGRGEYVVALSGVGLLREMTVELMLEESEVPLWKRGGALRRNPLLTAEQRQALEALPPLRADRDSVVGGHTALAALFLPRARRLAARIEAAWPEALEAATRRTLEARLGVWF